MPSEPATKDELKMMIEVQSKATEQMVLVAQRLQEIVTTQNSLLKLQEQSHDAHEKIIDRLYNGMAIDIVKGIVSGMTDKISQISQDRIKDTQILESIKKDTGWQKIVFGSLTLLIAIAFLINQIVAHFASHP